jgi:1-acyl-sn-glycerol-3-phosphate acyltransferase
VAYWILKGILSPILFLFWRVEVVGREHVPTHGPAVLAANHQSFCDSFFLPLVVRRQVTYVAKSEYFDDWKTAWFFRAAGQIPLHRGGGDKSQRALDTAKQVLVGGGLLGIYPEGTRSPDVRLHRGHTGVARLAIGCDVPIIPVGIVGTRSIQPPGRRLMRPFHRVTIRFGPPLTYVHGDAEVTTGQRSAPANTSADEAHPDPDQDELRKVTDTLMTAIASLSGQEYVDHYASRDKASAPSGPGGHSPTGGNDAPGGAVDMAS